eukprot:TRINITY_DN24753_c0_g1_i2.p1 TRINITY_DN24753_c0_g1~~TRINITY_DN24753_c0_g1_i2.p1  ORF type:complete len:281 (+),score=36.32 TRINITY_DN24753_c0_g1_i2:92-934(+)
MWSFLVEGTDQAVALLVGGTCLVDTLMLKQVCRQFAHLSKKAITHHLDDASPAIRVEALQATIRVAEETCIGDVKAILGRTEDKDASLRHLAVSALTYLVHGDDFEAPAVIDAGIRLLRDGDSTVRQAARSLLCTVARKGDRKVIAALVDIIQSEQACLRQEAIEALPEITIRGDEVAVAAVADCLSDESLAVRREAVATLGDIANYFDSDICELLCSHLTDPDPSFRCALAHASAILARLHPGTITMLISFLQDTHAEVRYRALLALGVVARKHLPPLI